MKRALFLVVIAAARWSFGADVRARPDADPGRPLSVPARALERYLSVRQEDGSYAPIFVKGINLGAALPGKYPTEFPRDVAVYLEWLSTIADLGANAVRVYTLLPPEFYEAVAAHNARSPRHRLWLIQGIWAELPDGDDFSNAAYVAEFEEEIARVIDAVHGDLVAGLRPGHASGTYTADASGALLALIIGREWEPYAVQGFDEAHPERTGWSGRYFKVKDARAMETWVAQMCDFAAGYEAKRYRMLHPLTFANWPTLDPLRHPSESNRDEEDAWRKRYGVPYPEALRERPWENDAVSLDATKIAATLDMPAGFFAAYHVYPNYPDFLNQETRYAAYLADLKRYHAHQPLLVAEFGISTSRGIAHVHPEGWNHGGHDERSQGKLVATMLRTIHDTGCAGAILFEFMDEWFKGTWSVAPLTVPQDRRRLWFNAESPEQSYGVIAMRPAAPVRVDGDPSDWPPSRKAAPKARSQAGWGVLRDLQVRSDEGYVYVLIRTDGDASGPDWKTVSFRLAIDTYDPARGVKKLPPPGAAEIATGAEFLIELGGPDASAVRVVGPYEPYAAQDSGPVASPPVEQAAGEPFVPLTFETNRERFGRDGTRYPAITIDRGKLRYGSLDPAAPDYDSRTDVAVGAARGVIEMRIPWTLLNVSDPSSRRVLHQTARHVPPFDTVETDGLRIYGFALDPAHADKAPLSRVPAKSATPDRFVWKKWEVPSYRKEPKAGVPAIREAFGALPDRIESAEAGRRDADAR